MPSAEPASVTTPPVAAGLAMKKYEDGGEGYRGEIAVEMGARNESREGICAKDEIKVKEGLRTPLIPSSSLAETEIWWQGKTKTTKQFQRVAASCQSPVTGWGLP